MPDDGAMAGFADALNRRGAPDFASVGHENLRLIRGTDPLRFGEALLLAQAVMRRGNPGADIVLTDEIVDGHGILAECTVAARPIGFGEDGE